MRWGRGKSATRWLLAGWLLLAGCLPQSPVLPSATATFKLIVADSHKTVQKIVEDRPRYLELDDRERMELRFRTIFGERVRVGERLGVELGPQSLRFSTPVARVEDLLPDEEREVGIGLTGTVFVPQDLLGIALVLTAETVAGDAVADIREEPEIGVDAAVDIREEPEIGVEVVSGSGLVFGRLEGRLNRVELPFQPGMTEVNFPRGLGNLDLDDATLTAYLRSAAGFTSELALDIDGINRFDELGNFAVYPVLARGNPEAPVDMVLQPRSAGLAPFLNLLPVEVVVRPTVWVGDGKEIEVIEPGHWVQLDSVVFHAGPRFRIRADTRVENDPIYRQMGNEEMRTHVQKRMAGARLITTIESHVEIDIRVSLTVARNPDDLYVDPDLVIPPQGGFWVRPAATDAAGRVIETVTSRREVEMSREDILLFLEEEGVYTGVLVQFGGTEDYLEMEGGDFFNVHTAAEITTDVGGVSR